MDALPSMLGHIGMGGKIKVWFTYSDTLFPLYSLILTQVCLLAFFDLRTLSFANLPIFIYYWDCKVGFVEKYMTAEKILRDDDATIKFMIMIMFWSTWQCVEAKLFWGRAHLPASRPFQPFFCEMIFSHLFLRHFSQHDLPQLIIWFTLRFVLVQSSDQSTGAIARKTGSNRPIPWLGYYKLSQYFGINLYSSQNDHTFTYYLKHY